MFRFNLSRFRGILVLKQNKFTSRNYFSLASNGLVDNRKNVGAVTLMARFSGTTSSGKSNGSSSDSSEDPQIVANITASELEQNTGRELPLLTRENIEVPNTSKSAISDAGKSHHSSATVGNTISQTAEAIAANTKYYTDFINKQYATVESQLLYRVSERNKRNARIALLSFAVLTVLVTVVFGTRIQKGVSAKTADIAKETLENESLQIQTQELAMAVVQTVLNDQDVTDQASAFLQSASTTEETQAALLALLLHAIKHESTIGELQVLVQKVLSQLSNDPITRETLVNLFIGVFRDPRLKDSITELLVNITNDEVLTDAVKKLVLSIAGMPELQDMVVNLIERSSVQVLSNSEVKDYSREFLTEVIADARVQRESGAALYNSVVHAMKPGLLRICGGLLIVASVGLIEIILTAY